MDARYKALREAFVSEHIGGAPKEIYAVTAVAPAAAFLWATLQARQRFFDPYTPQAYAVDFLLSCCAILCATTVYSDQPFTLIGLLLVPAIALYINPPVGTSQRPKHAPKKVKPAEPEPVDYLPVKPFVTTYRGAMMVITCVCILAVDFRVFPRRFAKTESIGTSLMDLGVGSFVFSAGVVSVRQQLKEEEDFATPTTFLQRMNDAIRHSLPLFALGFLRMYTVKGLNYAEHVSEYGVHWNFFFTLGLLPPFVAIFQSIFKLIPSYAALGYTVSLVQQVLFVYSDLLLWAMTAERVDWITSNKEGIVSFAGYFAIFLAGQGLGRDILLRDQDPLAPQSENDLWTAQMLGGEEAVKDTVQKSKRFAIIALAKWSLIWCVVLYFTTGAYGPRLPVLRRVANMGYVIWVNAFNTVQLLVFCGIESMFFANLYTARDKATEKERIALATSKVLAAYNRNGFAIFLLANLLTGLINLTLPTLEMSDLQAMAVLVVYMGTLTAAALGLDHYGVSIKL